MKKLKSIFGCLVMSLTILSVMVSGFHVASFSKTNAATGDLNWLNSQAVEDIAALPSFDSRNYGIVTPVKDQGGTNICWAYASINASETSILKSGIDKSLTEDSLRLSPVAVAYSRFKRESDPLGNTGGDYSSADYLQRAGSPQIAAALFSQWCGPIKSSLANNSNGFLNSEYHLTDAINIYSDNLSNDEFVNEIKKAVAKFGAVTYSYYNCRNAYYYNPSNETSGNGVSHACTIIGWDDNISANSFEPKKDGVGASQNGGLLIKNS